MKTKAVTIHAAKVHLSHLIERACDGDDIVIARRNVPVVRLVPIHLQNSNRKFGAMKGRARAGAEIFEPLPEDEIEHWS